jgi:hypothetical protein
LVSNLWQVSTLLLVIKLTAALAGSGMSNSAQDSVRQCRYHMLAQHHTNRMCFLQTSGHTQQRTLPAASDASYYCCGVLWLQHTLACGWMWTECELTTKQRLMPTARTDWSYGQDVSCYTAEAPEMAADMWQQQHMDAILLASHFCSCRLIQHDGQAVNSSRATPFCLQLSYALANPASDALSQQRRQGAVGLTLEHP